MEINLSVTEDEFRVLHNLFLRELHKNDCSLPECTWGEHNDCTTCNLDTKMYEIWKEIESGNVSQDSDAIQA